MLQWYGADPLTYVWIADFLINRTQAVVLEGETCTSVPVTSGVPQGTVLGPILFLVYINDLPECISNSIVRLFTDDCIFYRKIDSTADCVKLQDDLNALYHWEDMWLMTFSAKKCNTMQVSSSPKPISFDYSIHNTVLENVPPYKIPKCHIQFNLLTWDVHCKQAAAKVTNTLNVLKWNLKSTKEVSKKAFKSLVCPQVKYAASVWSPWLARDKARIERVQCRAAHYVYNTFSRYSSFTAMLQSLDWEILESHRFNMCLCIIYKAYYNLAMFPLLD